MLDPAIIDLFQDDLKKELKNVVDEDEIQKIYTDYFLNWLESSQTQAEKVFLTTHPAKFTHSKIKFSHVSMSCTDNPYRQDGYLRSGNVNVKSENKYDVQADAKNMKMSKFLCLVLQDGKTVYQHLEENTEYVKSQIQVSNYSMTRSTLLKAKKEITQPRSHGKLKQVYFPVEDDYHLLSILTPSGILFELKHKIQNLRSSEHIKSGRQARKNSLEHEGFNEVFDVTEIGFGGTKPQNVSILNNQNYGRAYLLPSLPPVMRREIRLPRKDFFHELLWYKQYQEEFQRFHKLLSLEINNLSIREGRNHWLEAIWDRVVQKAWEIRQHSEGWSEKEASQHLKSSQKIWLDDAYEIERSTQREWIQEVSEDFVRWFLWAYAKSLGSKSLSLGDDEVHAFSQLICKKEVSFL